MVRQKIKTWKGDFQEWDVPEMWDVKNLCVIPACIDAHTHMRQPGNSEKEDWETGALAAIKGGISWIFEMPNNNPSCVTVDRLKEKEALIQSQLKKLGIPFRYNLYLGADNSHLSEIKKLETSPKLIKIFMGSSTGTLLLDDPKKQDEAFLYAKEVGGIVAVHAEDESMILANEKKTPERGDPARHSKVRTPECAARAVEQAVEFSLKYDVPLYLLHISTEAELEVIRSAKKSNAKLLVEATPHHLFLSTQAYISHGTKALVNPPLRSDEDRIALWEAVHDGTIDVIGSDHAPHLLSEKMQPYPKAPSGVPGVETTLPLLLNEVSKGYLTLDRLVSLTSTNQRRFFSLEETNDFTLIDTEKVKPVRAQELASKCGWTPYEGWRLKGWPVAMKIKNETFLLNQLSTSGV